MRSYVPGHNNNFFNQPQFLEMYWGEIIILGGGIMPMCICDNTHIDTINDISSLLLKGVSVFWGITPSSLFLNIIIGDLQPNMILKINLH